MAISFLFGDLYIDWFILRPCTLLSFFLLVLQGFPSLTPLTKSTDHTLTESLRRHNLDLPIFHRMIGRVELFPWWTHLRDSLRPPLFSFQINTRPHNRKQTYDSKPLITHITYGRYDVCDNPRFQCHQSCCLFPDRVRSSVLSSHLSIGRSTIL